MSSEAVKQDEDESKPDEATPPSKEDGEIDDSLPGGNADAISDSINNAASKDEQEGGGDGENNINNNDAATTIIAAPPSNHVDGDTPSPSNALAGSNANEDKVSSGEVADSSVADQKQTPANDESMDDVDVSSNRSKNIDDADDNTDLADPENGTEKQADEEEEEANATATEEEDHTEMEVDDDDGANAPPSNVATPPTKDQIAAATDLVAAAENLATAAAVQQQQDSSKSPEAAIGSSQHQQPSYSTRGGSSSSSGRLGDLLTAVDSSAAAVIGSSALSSNKNSSSGTSGILRDLLISSSSALTTAAAKGSTKTETGFLSETLTEEERRTRTRYLPNVDGMQPLRKTEIKADLQLIRNSIKKSQAQNSSSNAAGGGTGAASNITSTGTSSAMSDDDIMSKEHSTTNVVPTKNRNSTIMRSIPIQGHEDPMIIPSTAFVLPPPLRTTTETSGNNDTSSDAAASKRGGNNNHTSTFQLQQQPQCVEAITAFNPPRPPESIGAKKQHRVLRWERRPSDIDIDLSNYRKTVHRTRTEWKNACDEYHRVELFQYMLRHHFLSYIDLLRTESKTLLSSIADVSDQCVNAAETSNDPSDEGKIEGGGVLPTRTRGSNNATCNANTSAESQQIRTLLQNLGNVSSSAIQNIGKGNIDVSGIGGVDIRTFQNNHSAALVTSASTPWIVNGDKVATPYGDGIVVKVYGPSDNSNHSKDLFSSKSEVQSTTSTAAMDIEVGSSNNMSSLTDQQRQGAADNKKKKSSSAGNKKKKNNSNATTSDALANTSTISIGQLLPPRVAVRLSYGVGLFHVTALKLLEGPPGNFANHRLAQRWEGLVATGKALGCTMDVATITHELEEQAKQHAAAHDASGGNSGGNVIDSDSKMMDVDDKGGSNDNRDNASTAGKNIGGKRKTTHRLVPVGSKLIPTPIGRGALLHQVSVSELDKELHTSCTDQTDGIRGRRENLDIREDVLVLDDAMQKQITLRARVLQLRNQLTRQRKIRILNEKTYTGIQDRASRVESLVGEMRTDLTSLKQRLDGEVANMGISAAQAEHILTSFYMSLDSQHQGEASSPPPKRRRSSSSSSLDDTKNSSAIPKAVDVAVPVAATSGQEYDEI